MANLLQIIAAHPGCIPEMQKNLNPLWVRDLPGAQLLQNLVDIYNHEGWSKVAEVFPHLADAEQNFLAGLSLEELERQESSVMLRGLEKIIGLIHLNHVQGELQIVWRRLGDKGLDAGQRSALMAEMQDLQKQKNALTART